jgi:hypothetical protein
MPSHSVIVGEAVCEDPSFPEQLLEQATASFLVASAQQLVAEHLIPIEELVELWWSARSPLDDLIGCPRES